MENRVRHLPIDLLPLGPLLRESLSQRPAPASFGGRCVPARPDQIPPRPAVEDPALLERADLAERLAEQLAPLQPHAAVELALEDLARPDSLAVVAGQQPGFMGGPLSTLHKALHAVALAAELRRAWKRPVVALFWVHGDDHDLAEVRAQTVLNRHLDLAKVGLSGMGTGRQAIGRLELDDERHGLGAVREHLRHLLAESEWRDPALDLFLPRPGETLASRQVRALTGLLGHTGLICLEPEWLRPELSRALARLVECEPWKHLDAGLARLRAAGLRSELEPERTAWVYTFDDKGRVALRHDGEGGYRRDDEPGSRKPHELAAALVDRPADFTAGALLRPLTQDLCLPTVATVGGPGELAYQAPLTELYRAANVHAPAFVPRQTVSLVSPATRTALRRLDATLADVIAARGEFAPPASSVARPAVLAELRAAAAAHAAALRKLRDPLAEVDRGLAIQLRRVATQTEDLVDKLARKAERVAQNRSGKARRHYRRLNNVLYPNGAPQERVLGTLAYLCAFGTEWIDDLLAAIDPFPTEHLVLDLRIEDDLPTEHRDD